MKKQLYLAENENLAPFVVSLNSEVKELRECFFLGGGVIFLTHRFSKTGLEELFIQKLLKFCIWSTNKLNFLAELSK